MTVTQNNSVNIKNAVQKNRMGYTVYSLLTAYRYKSKHTKEALKNSRHTLTHDYVQYMKNPNTEAHVVVRFTWKVRFTIISDREGDTETWTAINKTRLRGTCHMAFHLTEWYLLQELTVSKKECRLHHKDHPEDDYFTLEQYSSSCTLDQGSTFYTTPVSHCALLLGLLCLCRTICQVKSEYDDIIGAHLQT